MMEIKLHLVRKKSSAEIFIQFSDLIYFKLQQWTNLRKEKKIGWVNASKFSIRLPKKTCGSNWAVIKNYTETFSIHTHPCSCKAHFEKFEKREEDCLEHETLFDAVISTTELII